MRTRSFILFGAGFGAVASVLVSRAPLAGDVAITSHFLFLVSLPWSVLALGIDVLAMTLSGGDRMSLSLFYGMPVLAGAGWGWTAAVLRRRLRRKTRTVTPG